MISIDEYNDWFRASEYRSYRYANGYHTFIPPFHMAVVRMFMKFDGHFIRNGVKLVATTQDKFYNTIFDPKMIQFPRGYYKDVQPLRLNDVRHFMNFMYLSNQYPSPQEEWQIESLYTHGQGNYMGIINSLETVGHHG